MAHAGRRDTGMLAVIYCGVFFVTGLILAAGLSLQ
jgi:hypothetical protein